MKKKIIILGHTGLLGQEVFKLLSDSDYEVIGKSVENGFDMTNATQMDSELSSKNISIIINCAAFTDVEACEIEGGYETASLINSKAPKEIAKICASNRANFIHISSDYVFNGNQRSGYAEDCIDFHPMNKYGDTKLKAERAIIKAASGLRGSDFVIQNPKFYILRTQWLFGQGARNFIVRITDLAKARDYLEVVNDEIGCPTYAKDVAKVIKYLVDNLPVGGIYHAVSSNTCSRYEFAKAILELQGIKTEIRPSKLKDFKRRAYINNYSVLINTKLPQQCTWQEMLKDYLINKK